MPETSLEVCKFAFQNIFDVTPEQIRRLHKLLVKNELPKDLRGKASAANVIPGDVCLEIEEYIKSFPQRASHYSSIEVNYLNAEMNVKKMYDSFKVSNPDLKVTYWFYHKIFKERFSLRFGRPQVDSCVTCESLNVKIKSPSLNDAAKRVAMAELVVHKRRS